MFDFESFGAGIRYYRQQKHWTQAEFAERVGVGEQHINKIENGSGKPGLLTLVKMCNTLKVSVNDCLTYDHETGKVLFKQMKSQLGNFNEEERIFLYNAIDEISNL